jgi:hypothetical protein
MSVKEASATKCVVYVEVNDNSILNAGKYSLTSGEPVFDIAIIFAANINWAGGRESLYLNEQVQTLLDHADEQIRQLQAKGIKVLLSILGNHTVAGISNFQSEEGAQQFAEQVRATVEEYGLDGVDLDDEYADYTGDRQPNGDSIGWVISALRAAMPDKLVTFYNYGPAASYLADSSETVGAQLDYAWNAVYSTYVIPNVPGLTNESLGAAAVKYGKTGSDQAAEFATQTVSDGLGIYLTYDLKDDDVSEYISAFTQPLYGEDATYTG